MKSLALALFASILPFALASADRGPPRQPPKEAFDACAGAKRGDACTVKLHDHALAGTCDVVPDTTALACRPSRPPGPPPEAIEACRSAKEGDACTVTHGDRAVSGTCVKRPDAAAPLACHPAGAPPAPPPPR